MLHDWVSVELPQQDVPPLSAVVAKLLDLCWVPLPHVLLQVAQAPHDPQEQSTVYISIIFSLILSFWYWSTIKPNSYWVHLLQQFCFQNNIIPTGHVSALHDCSSVGPSVHSVPPLAVWVTMFLDLTWLPLPLVTLQSAHAPHVPHAQSTKYERCRRSFSLTIWYSFNSFGKLHNKN